MMTNTSWMKTVILLFSLMVHITATSENQTATSAPNKYKISNSTHKQENASDMEEFRNVMLEYVNDIMNRDAISILPGVSIEKKINLSNSNTLPQQKSIDTSLITTIRHFTDSHVVKVNLARATSETGRLFFFKGLKKFMWPLFIGFQIVKTALLVLFLPSIIGSVGKIAAKGLPSLSGTFSQFSNPTANIDQVEDLEFKDNAANSDTESEGTLNSVYQYAIPDNKLNFAAQMYEAAKKNNAKARIDKIEQIKASGFAAKRDDFKVFHDIPSSSHMLMNYDPFYSPLLSRLDAIFQQLGLGRNSDERCREKLVCLMYSNPAKYAPYSNLVSAQLSRELNELRKPTSDNPDILRFFKYMRAAKDGQDGIDCEISYKDCTSFNDMSGPAMISTFHDINKLVQARKF
ncbi:hypothetical protein PVAND_002075 [Polypedilum vanderplanki]|uniref:Uncharacterized protein n=1 Tax=Polypedilum vanderplanki TaxID=319348 RepID=A0A9J6BQ70_POLVA|nr:hypothetical protein PVAND_002075 [Polypedilum vanderplanki]